MSDYITIDCTDSFLKNAGIVGFIRFLKINKATENIDYIINNQELQISMDYLKNHDITQMYFDTITDEFESNTKFWKIINQDREKIDKLAKDGINNLTEDKLTNLSDLFKIFETEMSKASFATVFEILNHYNISDIAESDIEDLKRKQDYNIKYQKYNDILNKITVPQVKKQFIYTTLLYGDFKYFFNENKMTHAINVLTNGSKSRIEILKKNFYDDLIADTNDTKKKTICIECMQKTAKPHDNVFMIDTADDIKRKKSYYWNKNADAKICPVCTLLYLFVPLGFVFMGRTAVFINANNSVELLYKTMETYRSKTDDDNKNYYKKIYKLFTDEKLEILKKKLSNIQIIFKDDTSKHYNMKIIDKNTIRKLIDCNEANCLKKIEKIKLVYGQGKDAEYVNVYDEIFNCILSHKSMCNLINKYIKYEFSKDSNRYQYIYYILKSEIICNGGNNVNTLLKDINYAFNVGKNMRITILGKEKAFDSASESNNALRSYVYRLINLVSVGDVAQFIDAILRQYSGYGMTIPAIFKNCYESEERFKAIAHGYILGLKYYNYNTETNNESPDNKAS